MKHQRSNAPRLAEGRREKVYAAWPEPLRYAIRVIAELENRSRNSVAEEILLDVCKRIGIDLPRYRHRTNKRRYRRDNS